MSATLLPERPESPPRPKPSANGWFRAFWRWHFYASFLVIPVLLVLATTGLIYLFRFQIEPLLHADLMKVDQPAGVDVRQPFAAQQRAVTDEFPKAEIVSMTEPSGPDRSTVFSLAEPDGSTRDVFVDPWTAKTLGSLNPDTTVSGTAVRLHADLMSGTLGDRVMELGTCWAIVMALTGYYLFFKGRRARKRAGKKLRSRHAAVGSAVGVGLLLMVVTGLPWTGFWGAKVQELATAQGSSLWSQDHGAVSKPTSTLDESLPHSHAVEVPWGLGKSEVPESDDPKRSVANVDTALAVAGDRGLRSPMTVALPSDRKGTFSVIGYAFDDPTDERTVHVDRYGGQVVSTYGYDDYPALAKVVSQGIGIHEGRSFGLLNFWLSALFCVAVMFMCVTGPLMWWRRRPGGTGRVGAPRGRLPVKGSPVLLVGLVGLGVLLPFFGISLLVVLLLDQLLLRRVDRLGEFFDAA